MGHNENIIHDDISNVVKDMQKRIQEMYDLITDLESIQFRINEVDGYKVTRDDKNKFLKSMVYLGR
jgi:hypothetical protein